MNAEKSNLQAECTVIGKSRSPVIRIDFKPTAKGCFVGMGKFEMNGKIFFLKTILMPEAIGKIFESKKEN